MLNSAEHEVCTANKSQITNNFAANGVEMHQKKEAIILE